MGSGGRKVESPMQIWPAIDIRGGNCVRLEQGDYARETIYSGDPLTVARAFEAQGARHLHLVDLDGARDGISANRDVVADIVQHVSMECQLGGGVRDEATIRHWLDLGVQRLVVGTQAVRQPEWFSEMCRAYPGRLVLGLDARDGQVATDGWKSTSRIAALDLAQQFANEPLAAIVYTDIATDGMLTGPNLPELRRMVTAVDADVVASGGVARLDDLTHLAQIPVAGVIIGQAIYQKKFQVAEALATVGERDDT